VPFQAVTYSVSPSTSGAPVTGEFVTNSQRTPSRAASPVVIAARAGVASRASATARHSIEREVAFGMGSVPGGA
jgi:hypothetical protein